MFNLIYRVLAVFMLVSFVVMNSAFASDGSAAVLISTLRDTEQWLFLTSPPCKIRIVTLNDTGAFGSEFIRSGNERLIRQYEEDIRTGIKINKSISSSGAVDGGGKTLEKFGGLVQTSDNNQVTQDAQNYVDGYIDGNLKNAQNLKAALDAAALESEVESGGYDDNQYGDITKDCKPLADYLDQKISELTPQETDSDGDGLPDTQETLGGDSGSDIIIGNDLEITIEDADVKGGDSLSFAPTRVGELTTDNVFVLDILPSEGGELTNLRYMVSGGEILSGSAGVRIINPTEFEVDNLSSDLFVRLYSPDFASLGLFGSFNDAGADYQDEASVQNEKIILGGGLLYSFYSRSDDDFLLEDFGVFLEGDGLGIGDDGGRVGDISGTLDGVFGSTQSGVGSSAGGGLQTYQAPGGGTITVDPSRAQMQIRTDASGNVQTFSGVVGAGQNIQGMMAAPASGQTSAVQQFINSLNLQGAQGGTQDYGGVIGSQTQTTRSNR